MEYRFVLTKLNAETWEHGDIVKSKMDRARNMSGQIIRKDLTFDRLANSPLRHTVYLFGRENEVKQ